MIFRCWDETLESEDEAYEYDAESPLAAAAYHAWSTYGGEIRNEEPKRIHVPSVDGVALVTLLWEFVS